MDLSEHLELELQADARDVAAQLIDLKALEALHPLLVSVELEETRPDGERVWRCEDRFAGLPLVYRAHQRVDADGLGYLSQVSRGGLRLSNRWRIEPTPQGCRVTEALRFEGPLVVVVPSRLIGMKAHRGLFAALEARFSPGSPRTPA